MTARVAVTGSEGHLGRAVVADLGDHGYEVVRIDRVAPGDRVAPDSEVQVWDGRTVAGLVPLLSDCVALIHLAALPTPLDQPAEVVFANNTQATFAALEAAGVVGIRRCAIASSGSAYGTAWSPQPTMFSYVPVDEDHPMINYDPYGLSKEVDERTAAVMARRHGLSVAALRFHWIATAEQQRAAVADHRAETDRTSGLSNLWGYVDIGDAAVACRLAIEAAERNAYGFVPMNIVAADSLVDASIGDLVRALAPDTEIRSPLGPGRGAYLIERAAQVIGWVPQHSWRDPA